MELAKDEELLYQNTYVKHRKMMGTFFLSTKRIVWKASDNDELQLCSYYPEIKMQKISPDTSSKVQLQLQLHNGNSFNFHFANSDSAKTERDLAKDFVQQLLIKSRKKPSKELEEKSRLLKENPELYQLYKDLVVGNIISAEEFWSNRSGMLTSSSGQNIGVSPEFLTGANVNVSGCNTLKYNLSADMIESIFKTYPKVKKKHIECVPDKMNEGEFWTLFFQSQYFHRNRASTSNNAANELFGSGASKDFNDYLQKNARSERDPLLDLTKSNTFLDEAFGTNDIDGQSAATTSNAQLLQQFNHQSYVILHSGEKRDKEQNDSDTQKDRKKIKLREAVSYDELHGKDADLGPKLALKNTQVYAQGPTVPIQDVTVISQSDVEVATSNLKSKLKNWSANLVECISSEAACKAVNDLSPNGALMKSVLQVNLTQSVSQSLQDDLKKHYFALGELLRHFWSCFPVQSKGLEEKVERMAAAISKYKSSNLQRLKASLAEEHSHLADHLLEMINVAINKYKGWQDRQRNIRSR
ncbi:General transcription factor IIH subunit 1 [Trichoplax sp. H2]|nr:General transcription factor IIH subunit 1 [Trichoplax sp. H2]|eukprot:RDD41934.1 General transcription factor IIH subunit 1 [Trichoplax sp. H2]